MRRLEHSRARLHELDAPLATMTITVKLKTILVPHCRGRQGPAPGQPHANLLERLNAPLGAGQRPAQGVLMRAGESAEELRLKEERLEQERAAQRKKESEAKRKAEVRMQEFAQTNENSSDLYLEYWLQIAA